MNAPPRRRPGADRRRQRLLRRPRRAAAEWKGPRTLRRPRRQSRLRRRLERRRRRGRRRGDRAAQPRHRAARRGARPARRRGRRARRAGRAAGAEPRRHAAAVGERPRGRGLAMGAGAGPGARCSPAAMLARTEPYRLERRAAVTWLTGACVAGPTEVLRRLGPVRPGAAHVRRGRRPRPARGGAGVGSWFDPTACRIVHYGQGSSTLVYGSREGWRPTGTLNWRAAVRRATARGASGSAGARCGSTCACACSPRRARPGRPTRDRRGGSAAATRPRTRRRGGRRASEREPRAGLGSVATLSEVNRESG